MPRQRPNRAPVIAIDGPAGAGKSTLARKLATRLGLPYINTGLMYRALAATALVRGVDPDDEVGLEAMARGLRFHLDRDHAPRDLLINGGRPGRMLASPRVEAVVSTVARHGGVRSILRAKQRALGAAGGVIEGRDIGTVVFPDADLKVFLSAVSDVRADRRRRERGSEPGVREAVARRDELDARTNPLSPAPDAHVLDTTTLSPQEVLAETLRLVAVALPGVAP
jgi:cytidylate kinase